MLIYFMGPDSGEICAVNPDRVTFAFMGQDQCSTVLCFGETVDCNIKDEDWFMVAGTLKENVDRINGHQLQDAEYPYIETHHLEDYGTIKKRWAAEKDKE